MVFMLYYIDMEKKLWFKAKQYGWGWTPCTWEGWAVIGLYLLGVIPSFTSFDTRSPSTVEILQMFPSVVILTIFLIIICYLTGEKPRWRWGK